ncbi:uncharacterized protein BJ171DRAFT_197070 [Polychytrium aggregatum]|uniref:uncharacterized protein n=1 Tax=Polychytrium aggregatum TaxID=110093 RepID=UPI0022FE70C8|nr:uncharacterized protein BJ171DRAFT_197070 [Polychytrium aggregatum]KAI9201885.1 hypothetical protein BJ171DRAFT_197070 [Polychytrium aggregatum]
MQSSDVLAAAARDNLTHELWKRLHLVCFYFSKKSLSEQQSPKDSMLLLSASELLHLANDPLQSDSEWYRSTVGMSFLVDPSDATAVAQICQRWSFAECGADLLRFASIEHDSMEFWTLFKFGPPQARPQSQSQSDSDDLDPILTDLLDASPLEERYLMWSQLQTDRLWKWYGASPSRATEIVRWLDHGGPKQDPIGFEKILNWHILFHASLVLVHYPAMIKELWLHPDASPESLPGYSACHTAAGNVKTLMNLLGSTRAPGSTSYYECLPFLGCLVLTPLVLHLAAHAGCSHPPQSPESAFPDELYQAWVGPLYMHLNKRLSRFRTAMDFLGSEQKMRSEFTRLSGHDDPGRIRKAVTVYQDELPLPFDLSLGPWVPSRLWVSLAGDE